MDSRHAGAVMYYALRHICYGSYRLKWTTYTNRIEINDRSLKATKYNIQDKNKDRSRTATAKRPGRMRPPHCHEQTQPTPVSDSLNYFRRPRRAARPRITADLGIARPPSGAPRYTTGTFNLANNAASF
ncbi:hypothetical protein EVAR_103534_1 [Eumeta japonica]|uniref:Uncharacterized protein n=1 Tax=Eumeta variegata TaxID=151549 RepID=A0A4C1YEA0_EUMVA|nr:hypothetical protein EVAR_103534_1 [Eumeta japonica]